MVISGSWWFLVILGDSSWFLVVLVVLFFSWWFVVILDGSGRFLLDLGGLLIVTCVLWKKGVFFFINVLKLFGRWFVINGATLSS